MQAVVWWWRTTLRLCFQTLTVTHPWLIKFPSVEKRIWIIIPLFFIILVSYQYVFWRKKIVTPYFSLKKLLRPRGSFWRKYLPLLFTTFHSCILGFAPSITPSSLDAGCCMVMKDNGTTVLSDTHCNAPMVDQIPRAFGENIYPCYLLFFIPVFWVLPHL